MLKGVIEMNFKLISVAALFLLCSSIVYGDEIVLNNGNIFEGNIVSIDDAKNILIDLVFDDKLVGINLEISSKEIRRYRVDNKYKNLKREEIKEEDKLASLILLLKQKKDALNIDLRIKERTMREMKRIRDIENRQEDKRRFQTELEHEKEMQLLQMEIQKELIKHSKNVGVKPNVYIVNENQKKDH